jgi:hypothetical protein
VSLLYLAVQEDKDWCENCSMTPCVHEQKRRGHNDTPPN